MSHCNTYSCLNHIFQSKISRISLMISSDFVINKENIVVLLFYILIRSFELTLVNIYCRHHTEKEVIWLKKKLGIQTGRSPMGIELSLPVSSWYPESLLGGIKLFISKVFNTKWKGNNNFLANLLCRNALFSQSAVSARICSDYYSHSLRSGFDSDSI